MKIMITGGAGFIGSNFVHHLCENDDYEIVVLDKLTYAGDLENLNGIRDKIEFVKGAIEDEELVSQLMKDCDMVVNFAAETHVDRSIEDPGVFVKRCYRDLQPRKMSVNIDVERYLQYHDEVM